MASARRKALHLLLSKALALLQSPPAAAATPQVGGASNSTPPAAGASQAPANSVGAATAPVANATISEKVNVRRLLMVITFDGFFVQALAALRGDLLPQAQWLAADGDGTMAKLSASIEVGASFITSQVGFANNPFCSPFCRLWLELLGRQVQHQLYDLLHGRSAAAQGSTVRLLWP
jgi:hypothetical protein